jgi:hypothetical protein
LPDELILEAEVRGRDETRLLTNAVRALSAFSSEIGFTATPDHLTLCTFGDLGWGCVYIPIRFFTLYDYRLPEPTFLSFAADFLARAFWRLEGEKPVSLKLSREELRVSGWDGASREFRTKALIPAFRERMETLEKTGIPELTPFGRFTVSGKWDEKKKAWVEPPGLLDVLSELSKAFREKPKYERGGLMLENGVLKASFANSRYLDPIGVYVYPEKGEGWVVAELAEKPATYREFGVELEKTAVEQLRKCLESFSRGWKWLTVGVGRADAYLAVGGELPVLDVPFVFAISALGWDPLEWVKPDPRGEFGLKIEEDWNRLTTDLREAMYKGVIKPEEELDIYEWAKAEAKSLADAVARGELKVEEAVEKARGVFEEARVKAKLAKPAPAPPPPKFKVGDRVKWLKKPPYLMTEVFTVKEMVWREDRWIYLIDGATAPEEELEPVPEVEVVWIEEEGYYVELKKPVVLE